ncbi:xylose ABC transporter ATP-binding protein [Planctomycetales bacterium]|nr:xylose ABC transporter ATP-binding protein [Planctomycetales bacterium]GHT00105.1 xylose ABC transporter ATP-binding protein [Planctomycetales bacterium]GHT04093.1 xylose ABC transporter ATP-binding protein [Planctomycetales bacterium]
MADPKILLEMKDIKKTFGPVVALHDVNLQIIEGEIHALCGENGAGKSTLMNVLSGVYPFGSYSGDIVYNGKLCQFAGIKDSEKRGIVIIHQELALIPFLSIGENLFLGNERGVKARIDWDKTYADAAKFMKQVGLDENPHTLVKDIGVGKQQLVEIAKALAKSVRLLILDEPTASLNERDSKNLLDLLLSLKKEGVTSIIISHKLEEIAYVADRITVIRDGASIQTMDKKETPFSQPLIIKAMVGRELTNRFPKRENQTIGEVEFAVKNWTVYHPLYEGRKVCDNVNINVRRGEIVGISGLMGAGRTELAMSIFGKSYGANISGELYRHGKALKLNTIKEAIDNGIAYVTEDRKGNGLVLGDAISRNATLARMDKVSSRRFKVIDHDQEVKVADSYRQQFSTKCASVRQNVGNLSGGNQQKVLLGKWLFADPEVLILDEPTRGIDVGAKYDIYVIINQLVADGKCVIMISSEMPELLGMCDRIYVMNEGKIVAEMPVQEASQEKIMAAILQSDKK